MIILIVFFQQYFQSAMVGQGTSRLTIEWTNQHGCGGDENRGPHKLNCNIVLQYMVQDLGCPPSKWSASNPTCTDMNKFYVFATGDDDCVRNGANTNTQNYNERNNNPYAESASQYMTRKANSVVENRGLHESFDYYNACYMRSRNKGKGNTNIASYSFTRSSSSKKRFMKMCIYYSEHGSW